MTTERIGHLEINVYGSRVQLIDQRDGECVEIEIAEERAAVLRTLISITSPAERGTAIHDAVDHAVKVERERAREELTTKTRAAYEAGRAAQATVVSERARIVEFLRTGEHGAMWADAIERGEHLPLDQRRALAAAKDRKVAKSVNDGLRGTWPPKREPSAFDGQSVAFNRRPDHAAPGTMAALAFAVFGVPGVERVSIREVGTATLEVTIIGGDFRAACHALENALSIMIDCTIVHKDDESDLNGVSMKLRSPVFHPARERAKHFFGHGGMQVHDERIVSAGTPAVPPFDTRPPEHRPVLPKSPAPKAPCDECRGTGRVELFTSAKPCSRCR